MLTGEVRTMVRRSIGLGLLMLFIVLCGTQTSAEGDIYAWDSDLLELEKWVALEKSFTDETRREALQTIEHHRKEKTTFTEAGFYMEVRRIVGFADNGHSNVTTRPIYQTFGLVPIRAYWFSDGPYIVRAHESFADYLGFRIEAIDGKTIADLENTLGDYFGGSEPFFRRIGALPLVLCPKALHAVGLAKSPDRIRLRLSDESGSIQHVELAVDRDLGGARAQPWRYLNPAPIQGEQNWVAFHDSDADLPRYLQEPEDTFRYALLEDGELAYIQLRSNYASGGTSVRTFVDGIRKQLAKDGPHSIVLDNRQNPGGDLGRTADFALALPSLTNPEGKVYVLTGSGTFSAGIYTSFYPKAAAPSRTVILGERVGDRTRFWAETGPAFRLSKSGYGIGYAKQMHDPGEGCKDKNVCHLSARRFDPSWNLAVGSLDPDVPVPTRFEDFAAGRDRPLERVLADFR
jgi:hypothetical protein